MRGSNVWLAAFLGEASVYYPQGSGPFQRRSLSEELGIDLEAEYQLIQAKKSKLSRRDSERVVYAYEAKLRASGAQGKEGAP